MMPETDKSKSRNNYYHLLGLHVLPDAMNIHNLLRLRRLGRRDGIRATVHTGKLLDTRFGFMLLCQQIRK